MHGFHYRPKIKFYFRGLLLTSHWLNLQHWTGFYIAVYGNFQGLFLDFRGLFFAFRGRNRPEPPCNLFPGFVLLVQKEVNTQRQYISFIHFFATKQRIIQPISFQLISSQNWSSTPWGISFFIFFLLLLFECSLGGFITICCMITSKFKFNWYVITLDT